jgi:hypothetical protein
MSTEYGRIVLRDGRTLAVEAFGMSGTVKLITVPSGAAVLSNGTTVLPDPKVIELPIDGAAKIDSLITLLEIARDHVWDTDGKRR